MSEQTSLVRQPAKTLRTAMPILEQERHILQVGAAHHWPFRVLGVAPVPAAPVYHQDWWLVPAKEDRSLIPAWALERVQAIYAAGIRPQTFMIAHETPRQLDVPAGIPKVSRIEYWGHQMANHSVTALKVAGQALVIVTPILLTGIGLTLLAAVGLAGAILTDPCLIAVTEDDVWIQIAYWKA